MDSLPLDKPSRFSLDAAGILGFLGGDYAVSAMTAVHVYGNRRWLGWYNNPGSFQMSNQLASFAKSTSLRNNRSPKSLSDSVVHTDPTSLFGLDDCKGPKFRTAHSGTVIEQTGHVAAQFMKECAAWDSEGKVVPGRKTQPVGITVVDLDQAPPSEMHPARTSVFAPIFASIPIVASIGACVLCAVFGDWYASSLILVGIIASGVSSLVFGSADLVFNHPEPAKGSPAGDGILSSDKEMVVVRGTEGGVNSITRGRFSLRFSSEGHYHLARWCSLLFFFQGLSQLLLVAQASLFGQIMFLLSLAVSAAYNGWLSLTTDQEKMHRRLLFESVLGSPRLTRYTLGTRTTAVVFVLLVLQPRDPAQLLDELLPNDTKVWKQWKATVLDQLRRPGSIPAVLFEDKVGDELDGFAQQEKDLLGMLYEDARAAYVGYKDYLRVDSL